MDFRAGKKTLFTSIVGRVESGPKIIMVCTLHEMTFRRERNTTHVPCFLKVFLKHGNMRRPSASLKDIIMSTLNTHLLRASAIKTRSGSLWRRRACCWTGRTSFLHVGYRQVWGALIRLFLTRWISCNLLMFRWVCRSEEWAMCKGQHGTATSLYSINLFQRYRTH